MKHFLLTIAIFVGLLVCIAVLVTWPAQVLATVVIVTAAYGLWSAASSLAETFLK